MRLHFNGPQSPFLDDTSLSSGLDLIVPSYTTSVSQDPRLLITDFGDGYSQRTPDGINYTPMIFNVNFDNRDNTVITAIRNFFLGLNSYYPRTPEEPFLWTPPAPYDAQGESQFTFSKLNVSFVTFGSSTLTVVFTQNFEP